MVKARIAAFLVLASVGCGGGQGGWEAVGQTSSEGLTNGGYYNFGTLVHAGSCMDVAGGSTADGASVQEWTCNGTGAQQFQLQALDSTYFQIVNPQSGKCLDITGNQTADGTRAQLWTCWGGANQAFTLQSSNGFYRIVGKQSGKCVDVSAANPADGTGVQLWTCNGTNAQTWNASLLGSGSAPPSPPPGPPSPPPAAGGIAGVVSSALFDQMFPNRNPFYTYEGLTSTAAAYVDFANSADETTRKREAAAFLANVAWETGNLVYIEEIDKSGDYCDPGSCGGCPAGTFNYYGRGPLQISWNCNYAAAGGAIGADLLSTPSLVATDPSVSWKTAVWFWMTSSGANTVSGHTGITCTDAWCGFGQTIRTINGGLECDGKNPSAMQGRVNNYTHFCDMLGVSYGNNLGC